MRNERNWKTRSDKGRKPRPFTGEVISRSEYREILLARMAGGDLYASETLLKIRAADRTLDMLRERPIYK